MPVSGYRLGTLAAVWLLGRIIILATAAVPVGLAAAADLLFMPALVAAVFRPLLYAKKPHNLMLPVPLTLFWFADWAMQAEFVGWTTDTAARGARIGIDVLLVLITMIGGLIVPSYTANVLQATGVEPTISARPVLDRAAVGAMVLLLVVEAATGLSVATGVVALAAAALNAARLACWRGERTLASPILWVLHLGYLWLAVGLALKGVAAFALVPESAALHALGLGAIGTMIFAVMSRAGLGHTGRPLKAHRATAAAYALISVAALLRVAASLAPGDFVALLWTSGIAWIAAALLFLGVYVPILLWGRSADR